LKEKKERQNPHSLKRSYVIDQRQNPKTVEYSERKDFMMAFDEKANV